jgi:putative transposon-encoded protein
VKKPPCKVDGIDCPRRYIGCRAECEEYHNWLAKHDEEKAQIKAARDKYIMAEEVLIKQTERVKKARHRDYMRGYRK